MYSTGIRSLPANAYNSDYSAAPHVASLATAQNSWRRVAASLACQGLARADRRIRYVVQDKHEARKLVRRTLQRRATARKRVGVGYRFRELIDPNDWCPSPFYA